MTKKETLVLVIVFICLMTRGMAKANTAAEGMGGTADPGSRPVVDNSTGTDSNRKIDGLESPADQGWWNRQPKETKAFITNGTAAALIGVWGLIQWDYGSAGIYSADEGWFEKDSKYGGADKLGHLWATYVFSDALTGMYQSWGYSTDKANNYGALSAWAVQAAMEIFDGTSKTQGFSYEDMVMNTVGALTSVVLHRYPEVDNKIDFRMEYAFNVSSNGIFDDYSNQSYAMVVKLDGFKEIDNTLLKYLEFHLGYYSRGYDSTEVDKTRAVYGGVSFNFSRLLKSFDCKKSAKVLEYVQIPYTTLRVANKLD